MEQVSSINRWSKARKNLKRPKRNTSSTFRNVYKKLSTTDPQELDICIEETSRDQSSPLSEEEEYRLLKTTNVLVIFFTTWSHIWPYQNLSSSKSAQRDFLLKDGENRKQTEINYYDLMIMRIFIHTKNDSLIFPVNWFWLPLFMTITPSLLEQNTDKETRNIFTTVWWKGDKREFMDLNEPKP